jgi:hypothetical protein
MSKNKGGYIVDQNYLNIANSAWVLLIVAIPILIVVVQAILFLRISLKEASKQRIPKETVKKVITSSAVFSIIPSLPILISLAVLMPVLGKFIPWLRLSVMGSATYESFAADLTIKAFGLTGLGDLTLSPKIFVPILNIFVLKTYDKKLKNFNKKPGGFMMVAVGAMFIGMLSILFVPVLLNYKQPVAIITAVVAGACVVLLDWIARKSGKKAIGEFSFPLSMVIGMAAAVLANSLI